MPDMVVLHHTAMLTADAAIARLSDPTAEVSAHYVIAESGAMTRLVDEKMRAWHAGRGAWGRVRDVNSHSIGIELANPGPLQDHPPFPEAQMAALEWLLSDILARWCIPPERVIGHSDMAPDRKADPGPAFDWQRLAKAGVSIWPRPVAQTAPLRALLADVGYDTTQDAATLLAAFRLRFCPDASGAPDQTDLALLSDLAQRFPVDQTIRDD